MAVEQAENSEASKEAAKEYLKGLGVESPEFAEALRIFSEKIIAYRDTHEGRLPKPVWLETLPIGGSYPCLEILVRDPKGNLLMKRRRDETATAGELVWEGKLHIPGMATVGMDLRTAISKLLAREIVKDPNMAPELASQAKRIGTIRYPEPERRTVADTEVVEVTVDLELLQEGFEVVTEANFNQVIDQHKPTLSWMRMEPRPELYDTRFK